MAAFAVFTSPPATAMRGGGPNLNRPMEYEWQRFSIRWTPVRRGATTLASLAEANSGQLQPMAGRRNRIHQVSVDVI
jgi:hypothetical protein